MNIAQLASAIGFEEAEYREILDLFVASAFDEFHVIKSAADTGSDEAAERAAHSMKGAAANLGLMDVSDAAARIESAARTRRLADAGDVIRTLAGLLERIVLMSEGENAAPGFDASCDPPPKRGR